MNFKIDFVVSWVDSSDSDWKSKMLSFLDDTDRAKVMAGSERYTDYDIFKYWFRAVENYAPWVNKVYLITADQKPEFFSETEKFKLVSHREFIPSEYLPTFSSSVIELYLNKISGIADHFVYFNDDMFINNPVTPSDFFTDEGLPLDMAISSTLQPISKFDYLPFNDVLVINQFFRKKDVLKKHFGKFFTLKYGIKNLVKSALTLPFENWSSFKNSHLPYSLRKKDYDLLEKYAEEEIKRTSRQKFRSSDDINIWLLQNLRFVTGNFAPRSYKDGMYFDFSSFESAIKELTNQRTKFLVINDDGLDDEEKKLKLMEELKKKMAIKFNVPSSVEK